MEIKDEKLQNDKIRVIDAQFTRLSDTKTSEAIELSGTFKIPSGMTFEDSCKIVSYVKETIEQERHTDTMIPLTKALISIGFESINDRLRGNHYRQNSNQPAEKRKIGITAVEPIAGVVDLITNYGDLDELKLTDLGDRYTDAWFTPNVTKEEVKAILDKVKEAKSIDNDLSM